MAIATATSAAAMAIINIAKKYPSICPGNRYLLKITKFIATEFIINSADINIEIRFFLVKKPYIPIKNTIVESANNSFIVIPCIIIIYDLFDL